MGDMADAILNGDFCQNCGEWLGDGDGFPRSCPGCGDPDEFDDVEVPGFRPKQPRVRCKLCGKRVGGLQGLADHVRDKHPGDLERALEDSANVCTEGVDETA